MATRYAVATGNWSDPLIWNGGTLPDAVDSVYSNTFTVTIDQDIECVKISNRAAAPALTGGGFLVNAIATVRNLNCDIEGGAAGQTLNVTAPSGTINTNNIFGGNATNGCGVALQAGSLITFNALDLTASTGSSQHALVAYGPFAQTINVRDLYGAGTSGAGIVANNTTTINARHVYGGQGTSTGPGITSSGAVTVTMASATSRGSQAGGVFTNANAVVDCQGPVTASNSHHGIQSSATSLRVRGPLYNAPNNRTAVYGQFLMLYENEPTAWHVYDDANYPLTGNIVPLGNALEGVPTQIDVRSGTLFGAGNSLTGTVEIPPAASVAAGVPVDNTEGTAAVSLTDVVAVTGSQIAASVGAA